ncbi:DUF4190 domain-containing protein [Streptomyces sp. NPDC002328]|uniref:DUF4190 domain-containing protein n=1 Tax=Streptomyces sp. NPDC002328 TaxID=3364642 RepID=UPI0036890AF1
MSIPPPPGPHQPQDDPYRPPQDQAPQAPQGPTPQGLAPYPQGSTPYPHYPGSPQPPYGAPPYAAWGQGYVPFNRPAPVNGIAIAALVLGVLCFLPAVGLVLGIIALVQIKKRGERGKGMAIGGAVLSSLGLALWILALATGGGSVWEGIKDGAAGNSSLSLVEGDCFDVPGESFDKNVYDVDKVPCAGEHQGEVFGVVQLTGDDFPGDSSVNEEAKDKCWPLHESYVMDPWALTDEVDLYYLTPTRESWKYGDREITCVFGHTDEKSPLTGSLRADETTLDSGQLAFLKAMAAIDLALAEEPDDLAEDDLEGNQAWSADMADVVGEQALALRGHAWSAEARKPLADLAADLQKSGKQWTAAADASDVDAFYEHYDNAYSYVDGESTVTAREALGLATTPPVYGEGDGGESGDAGGGGLDV